MPPRADVVVVGAGLTGLSAARCLKGLGIESIVVLEASSLGAGASGRTGGIVLEGTNVGELDQASDCVESLQTLVQAEGIDCNLKLTGCWELEHVDSVGRFLWRDGDGAVRVRGTVRGGTIDPGALLGGLARVAVSTGVAVHEHVAVERLEPVGGARPGVRVRTSAGVVETGRVLVAVNAYAATLVPLPEPFKPALTLALLTESLEAKSIAEIGLGDGKPFYTVDLPYLWGRPLDGGRIIFGAGLAFDQDDAVDRIDTESGQAATALADLERRVRGLHSLLADVRVDRRWGGPIALLRGRAPFLGWHPAVGGVLVAAGYTGHGVALAIRAGELAAAAIARDRSLPSWGAIEPIRAPIS